MSLQASRLSSLPIEIARLETTIASIQSHQATSTSTNPSLLLPMPATVKLIDARQAELDELDRQLRAVQMTLPQRIRELERAEGELSTLETHKAGVVAAAKEARRRKEDGERGIGDSLELRGRWYRGMEAGLRDMLDIEG